ncbi:lysoplasmalogenase [Streptomyces sp. NPDC008313]|uniref:lysoplasmalogenase n=1 Tax=Streptomyces sp. NPDC008313 TaxID=3364826 RepID=UPI0036E19390
MLWAFALLAAVDLTSLAAGSEPGHLVAKPLLMPLLATYAAMCRAPRLLVAALLCGWGGDLLLLFDAQPAFLAGMASFAAGHVCYLLLFARSAPRARGALLASCYALALVVTVALLWSGLPGGLRAPVAGYSLLLTAMAHRATRLGVTAAAGGALFMLSDTLIATGVAGLPQLPRPDLWVMLTYTAAQYLLVSGVLGGPREPSAPRSAYGEVRSTTP